MNDSRLNQLLQFLRDEPDDPFLLYAVATEYTETDLSKTLYYYEKLLAEHPDYIATYYHAARLYADMGNRVKAEQTFAKGIEKASMQQESLALRELRNAYHEFLFDD